MPSGLTFSPSVNTFTMWVHVPTPRPMLAPPRTSAGSDARRRKIAGMTKADRAAPMME